MEGTKLQKAIIEAILDVLMDDDFEVVELSGQMACEIADLITPKILALIEKEK